MDELERVLYYGRPPHPHETMMIPTGNHTQPIPRGQGLYRSGQVWVSAQEEVRSRFEQSQRPSDLRVFGWAMALLGFAIVLFSIWFWALMLS